MSPQIGAGLDPRRVAVYDIHEAARYLRMPASTLRAWFAGQRRFQPVLQAAKSSKPPMLSFLNLVEAHILGAIRRDPDVALQRVRLALDTLHDMYPDAEHPLIDRRLETDGVDLFIREFGRVVNLSKPNQEAMRVILEAKLQRVRWGESHLPEELFPATTPGDDLSKRRAVSISPTVSFGRRVIAGTGIQTRIVYERYFRGESVEELAADYHRSPLDIQDAIRCEMDLSAA